MNGPLIFLDLDYAVYSITAATCDLDTMAMKKLLTMMLIAAAVLVGACSRTEPDRSLRFASTVAGVNGAFGEAFGVATKDGDIYVSDGEGGKIWRIHDGTTAVFAEGLATPSGITFAPHGELIVADSGSCSIKRIDPAGKVATLAGVDGRSGYADGEAASALFNAPIGVGVAADGRIFVADTYNDRIRVIESGKVTTMAGSTRGFADGAGASVKFDTPTGIAIWQDKLLVADTANRRIRVVEPNGIVWTLAGNGESDLMDGLASMAKFVQPTAIAVGQNGSIFIADGNAIREISGLFGVVRTISSPRRGLADGLRSRSQFGLPTGLAFDRDGSLLVADSENRLLRRISHDRGKEITPDEIGALRGTAEQFRNAAPARWPFDPPTSRREIAGTLGEIRGEMKPADSDVWFHNGLDIAGAYGETARFVRDEKVLRPLAAENFGTLRELLRMPTMGYIHVRLGRDKDNKPFGDPRFQFTTGASGKLADVRIPRGSSFRAGEPIGTLNAMNHVHLIAGRSGSEMNALDALILPGITDIRPPTIEAVSFFNGDAETKPVSGPTQLTGKVRVVMRAFDQVDGNAGRRRLGLYQAGYQLLRPDLTPVSDIRWNIRFDRLPPSDAVEFVYAEGSRSGATGETIFNYVVTNHVGGDEYSEGWLNTDAIDAGNYVLRVFAGDYFGNNSYLDTQVEVKK
jgi:sugar lactone lactonase YvrE